MILSKPPTWVKSTSVQQLLSFLLDRVDSADKIGTKPQSVALNAKSWPAMFSADRESTKEDLWEHLRQLVQWGWVSVTPPESLKSNSGYDRSPRLRVKDEAAVRDAVNRPVRLRSTAERWREAIEKHLDSSASVKKFASAFCIDIPGRSMDEVVQQLNLLKALAAEQLMLREVSSRLFWSMSKILDTRQDLVSAILETDDCPFSESPIQLQIFLPSPEFSAILFIENQMTFETAIRSKSVKFSGLALVYASGFKGSALRLRKRDTVSLYYSSVGELDQEARTHFEKWLFDSESDLPMFFWGDLDWSGMRILAAMRRTFHSLQAWAVGYGPMLELIQSGGGHAPEAADKAGQRPLPATGCGFADRELLPMIRAEGRFVDQEAFRL